MKTHTIAEVRNRDAYKRLRGSLSEDGLMPVCTRCCGLTGN